MDLFEHYMWGAISIGIPIMNSDFLYELDKQFKEENSVFVFRFCRGVNRDWNKVYTSLELFWNSLDNAPSSNVFYFKVKVGVHDIKSRFTTRRNTSNSNLL